MPEERAMPATEAAPKKTQIVVVGGGAGGLELVRRLGARFGRKKHDIILIDRNRTHVWKPLLHEVAAGSLDANLDEVGYRSHCARWGYRYLYGTLDGIDRAAGKVFVAPILDEDGSVLVERHAVRYDYLVLAIGSIGNDFGTPGARDHCLFLDDRIQADRFRSKLLDHCLRVSRTMTENPAADAHVRIAIIGAGATGVELAAELYDAAAALRHYGLEVFDESRLQVTLVEAGERILPQLDEDLAKAAHEELSKLGVRICTDRRVTRILPRLVESSGGPIEADLIVWAAGVKGSEILQQLDGLETSRTGQIVVTPTLQASLDPRIFAIGDCCSCLLPGQARPVPPRAQSAHQMATATYRNLVRLMAGRPLRPFAYRDRGSLVSLSRFSTVGSLMGALVGGRLAIEGRLARFAYVSLYRMHLIAIHGWAGGIVKIVISKINAVVRPRIKLH